MTTVAPLGALAILLAVACGQPDSGTPESADAEPAMAAEDGGEAEGEAGEEHAREGGEGEHGEGGEHGGGGEHHEGGEHGEGGEEGEESGEYIGRTQTWDATRRGLRLALAFDAERDTFTGTVENTLDATICAVRVEVHLSSHTELGPTEPADLGSGESISVELPTGGESFESWTAHPESSACNAG